VFAQAGQQLYQEPDGAWRILGALDFNGDRKSDIVWRNEATGQVYVMLMNAAAIVAEAVVHTAPELAWKVVALGDYDGDGRADLLWRNESTGVVYLMLMEGLSVRAQAPVYPEPDPAWRILGLLEWGRALGLFAP